MAYQKTLSTLARFEGVGLHSGVVSRVVVRPAAPDFGLVFRRTDLPRDVGLIRVRPQAVVDTRLGTTLGNGSQARVATVEHLLSAVAALGVDNAVIDIDGPEPPALDGSAADYLEGLRGAGVTTQAALRRWIKVVRPIDVVDADEGRRVRLEPSEGFTLDVSIDFANPVIGRQRYVFSPDAESFAQGVADARTFAFFEEVEALREAGLALGGSLENCVVLDGGSVLNPEGLRYADEFVRHKALDALGDLAVLGSPLKARYVAQRPGHGINNAVLRALLADPSAWRWETAAQAARRAARAGRRPAMAARAAVASA